MPHYYSKENVALNPYLIKIKFKGEEYEFYTGSGVFSRKKLDKGTEILISSAVVKEGEKILDLGCGIGVVGILLQKTKGIKPEFTDVSPNAISATKKNLQIHNIKAKLYCGDLYEKVGVYDSIIVNPPYVAGRDLCTRIVTQAKNYLEKNGTLQLVARYNKGGKYFEEIMKETFGNVKTLIKKSGYRVFLSENN